MVIILLLCFVLIIKVLAAPALLEKCLIDALDVGQIGQPEEHHPKVALVCITDTQVFFVGAANPSRGSFENLNGWIDALWKHNGKGKIPFIVLGNKYDLVDQFPNAIEEKDVIEFINKKNEEFEDSQATVEFLRTSAKTGLNIEQAFTLLGKTSIAFIQELKAAMKGKKR